MKSQSKVAIIFLLIFNFSLIFCDETHVQPGSNEDFVAIHRDAVGVKEELNPQIRSLMAMAITYLPKDFRFVRVISATREVVAGVRFNVLIDALDNNHSDIVCFIQVFEKPWIVTEYGSKFRILEYSNCTESGEEYRVDPSSAALAEQSGTRVNPIFQRPPSPIGMTHERLVELESQIVSSQTNSNQNNFQTLSQPQVQEQTSQIKVDDVANTPPSKPSTLPDDFQKQIQTVLENLFNTSPEIKAAIEEISNAKNTNEVQQKYESVLERLMQAVVSQILADPNSANESFSFQIPVTLSNPSKRIKSAIIYIDKSEVHSESATNTVLEDTDGTDTMVNNPSSVAPEHSRVTRSIVSAKRSQELDVVEVKDFIANQILDPLVKHCKDLRESKTNSCFKNRVKRHGLVGGWHETDAQGIAEAKNFAQQALLKVASGEGVTCELLDFKNVSSQVVSGIKYQGHVEHKCSNGEQKTCKLFIYSQPWTNTLHFDWQCPEYQKYTTKKLSKRSLLVGGAMSIDPLDEEVQKFGRHAVDQIDTGDGSKCEFLEIISAKRQVVSGLKYILTIRHKCGDDQKVCEANVWNQPWKNFTKVDWSCPDSQRQVLSKFSFGGKRDVSEEEMQELERLVIDALQVASQKNPAKNYNFVRITRASKQVVAGYSYNFEVDATDDEGHDVQCSVRIHVQKWKKNGNTVKMTCVDETFKFRQRRSVLHHDHRDFHSLTSRGEEHMRRLFDKFKIKHGREYTSNEEHEMRFRIFKQNLFKIEQLNRNEEGTAKYGVTKFADLTNQEFKQYTGFVIPADHENRVRNPPADILDIEIPPSFDWRDKNAVTEVKNQGSCGSCWAFSAIGNIEGQHAIKYGKLEEYSEQELVDCDSTDNGCNGGYMDDAFKAVEKLGGLETETEYPYEGRGEKCQFNSTKVHVRVKGAVDLPKNESAIAQYLVQNGPIAVALNANAMQFYRGGVSKPFKFLCSPNNLDHGVLLVGYGVAEYPRFNKVLPYWIIKNSWGKRWGEQGFYRLYRGDNRCGIANMASSAIIV